MGRSDAAPLQRRGDESFVAPLGRVDVVEGEGLFVEDGGLVWPGIFPGGDVGVVGVVAEGFAFGSLVLLAEVAAAGFVALERVDTHQFAEFQEMGDGTGFFERLVEFLVGTEDADFFPELFAKGRDQAESFLETRLVASHAAVIPDNFTEFTVERVDGAGAFGVEEVVGDVGGVGNGVLGSGKVRRNLGGLRSGEVIPYRVWNDEVAIGKALHQGAGAQAIGTVIGEVGFPENEQAGNGRHQVVVDPKAAHGVVGGGIDAHGDFVRVFACYALVHFQEVAVAFGDFGSAKALDAVGEIEIDTEAAGTNAATFVTFALGGAGGDVARNEIAKGGIAALEVVVALRFRDLVGRTLVTRSFGNPDAAVVAQRLGHQGELGLIFAGDRDAGRVNLGVAGIGEESTTFVGAPDSGDIATFGVGGGIEGVAVAAGGENDGVGEMSFDLAGVEGTRDDAAGLAVDDDQVEHVTARDHFDGAEADLALECLIGAEEKLLACLATRVEGAGDLGATERTVVEIAAVLAGERDTLCDALVDDVDADLREAVDVGFASAEVATLYGVVEEAENG